MHLMFVSMLIFFVLTVPIAVGIGFSAVFGLKIADLSPLVLVQKYYASLDSFPLATIPFFILTGQIMLRSGISERLIDFTKCLFGNVRGGLACTCIITSMIFAAIAGSGVATTFAVGSILIPALVKRGYSSEFATSLQACASELGVIIPPSVPMILYAVSTQTNIVDLFSAGFIPGIFIALMLCIYSIWYASKKKIDIAESEFKGQLFVYFKKAFLALLLPIIVLGGIYGGIFTPTEASIISVIYSLLIATIYGAIDKKLISESFVHTAISTSVILFLIANASVLSFLMNFSGIPQSLGIWITETFQDKIQFLLALNILLFVIGMFVETSASIVVLGPLLLPVALKFGIDPIHFGLIVVVNLALGMITPPFGVNLFAACTVSNLPIERVIKSLIPFVLLSFIAVLIITYLPL
ncbi:TRAP transporter large permease [Taylorella equigenitalis]|uniref:TRAP transporter large permease protein n=2 Tax=Taylorella equigenitalis TaxID=29575 RepID=A0A654KFP7_TAYEM|nr:TRAP transporter large permease [Taylorella equigenitalis]ADU91230.1 TRAP-type C4-dicarboxylate transport system, large permease component [Taylorella equigenitalis MCE9]ASY30901.1 C4-dicarboxylate ABC transporter permease [Taylorella equigenitalis]ASY38206.1 TRAP transporter large permease [Taylorella equigenitalis]ASY41179.1 C4-dicarboxylate ABC transporter permease [Taylorella equigenitalis]ASY42667.1 C4-dicarboxylate ABC transporter permease [Taylorella equigenitalis]